MAEQNNTPQFQVSSGKAYGEINTANTGVWRTVSDESGEIGTLWASDSESRAGIIGDFTNENVAKIGQILQSAYQAGFSPISAFEMIPFSVTGLQFGESSDGPLSEISDEPAIEPEEPSYFALFDDTNPDSPEFIGVFSEVGIDMSVRDEGAWIPVGTNRGFYDNDPISVDVTDKFVDLFDKLNSRNSEPTYEQAQQYAVSPAGETE